MSSSQKSREFTTEGKSVETSGSTEVTGPSQTQTLKPEDTARNALSCLGRDGHAMTREEFLSYHSPTNPSATQKRESLWAINFNDRRESSATHGVSRIYDDYTYPLVRFELTVLSTNFDGSDLRLLSSFLAVCEDPSDDVVARGEITDMFHPDHDVDGRYYLAHRRLTFTTIRRPKLLERRPPLQNNSNGRKPPNPNASRRYEMYLRLTYFARKLRELRQALNPSLGFSALAASIAANPTLSIQVRSGFAVTGTVISSLSCLFFASGILVEVLETKLRQLILEGYPQGQATKNRPHRRSNFVRTIASLKHYSALFVTGAAVTASVASHPDIPESTRRPLAVIGIVLAATGCALYIVSSTTWLLLSDGVVEPDLKGKASLSVELKALGSLSPPPEPD
ncbi:hypothetical protein BT69DRAFT_1336765 [Atractiella rhizophila]|nr:hypothetical protein BT69DRAFT_1336765 [Atractiella rhizophila]